MKMAAFRVICPLEIGDTVLVADGRKEAFYIRQQGKPRQITVIKPVCAHKVTDIATIHYLKTGNVSFRYELDGSGEYRELDVRLV